MAPPAADDAEDLEGVVNAQVTELDVADRDNAALSAALARAQAHITVLERDYDCVWRSHCSTQREPPEGEPEPGAHAVAHEMTARRQEQRALEAEIEALLRARNRVGEMPAGEELLGVRVLDEPDRAHIRALRASKRALRAQIGALEAQLRAAREHTARQRAEHDEAASALGVVRASMEAHNARLAELTARQEQAAAASRALAQRAAAEAAEAEAALAAAAARHAQLAALADEGARALRACEERRECVVCEYAQQLEQLERIKLEARDAAETRKSLQLAVVRLQGVLATIHAKYAEFCQTQLAQHDAAPADAGGAAACRACAAANDYIQQSFLLVEDIVDKLGESLARKELELRTLLQNSNLDDWHDGQQCGAPAARR